MKKLSSLLPLFLCLSCSVFASPAPATTSTTTSASSSATTAKTTPTILVFGDSLSAGYGLQAQEEWPFLLQQQLQQQKLPYKVVNASISGETTGGGLARFASTFDKHQPAIVILELGANDGLRGQSLQTMHSNLATMIQYSQQRQAQVLLVNMRIPPNYGKRYTRSFEQVFINLQKNHAILLTDFLLGSLSGHPELVQKDGLHPTAAAQPLLLATVWKSLKPLLQTK